MFTDCELSTCYVVVGDDTYSCAQDDLDARVACPASCALAT